jgi:hypothetical protein
MNEDRGMILSEVLFVLQNKFGDVSNNNLLNVLVSFYSDEEIVKAKSACMN